MKITRNVRRIAVAAALALVAGLAAAFLARNAIAASILRSTGSRLLGVRVDVDAVDIDVFGLAVAVDGLRVANPEGWGAPTALEAGHIRLALSGDSDASSVVVDGIDLDGISIWFVSDGAATNISAIVDNIPDAPKADGPGPEGPSMGLLIRRLTLTGVSVRYAPRSSAGPDMPVVANLPKVEVRDIDGRTSGSGIAQQLVGQVFEAVVLAVARESAGKLPDAVGGALQSSIAAGGHFGAAALEGLGGVAKGAGGAVGGFLKGIGDAVGGKKGG